MRSTAQRTPLAATQFAIPCFFVQLPRSSGPGSLQTPGNQVISQQASVNTCGHSWNSFLPPLYCIASIMYFVTIPDLLCSSLLCSCYAGRLSSQGEPGWLLIACAGRRGQGRSVAARSGRWSSAVVEWMLRAERVEMVLDRSYWASTGCGVSVLKEVERGEPNLAVEG